MTKLRVLIVFLLIWAAPALAAPSSDEATAAAKAWLAVIDSGKYAESWKGASAFFQQGVSEAKWVEQLQSIRTQLGPLTSRSFQAVELTKTLPGVPDGDYAIVGFQAVFANKQDAMETITLILEKGKWKAGGYFIR